MPAEFTMTINRFKEVQRKLEETTQKQLLAGVMEWHRGLISEVLVGNRSGRIYKVPAGKAKKIKGQFVGGRTYQASAPGEAPASRTGRLRTSYRFRVIKDNNRYVGEVGTPMLYGLFLQEGTRKMAKRPHLDVAFEKNKDRILKKLQMDWEKGLK